MKGVMMKIISNSQTGLVRKNNQDALSIVQLPYLTLLLVLDGVGGSNAGDVASSLIARMVEEKVNNLLPQSSLVDYQLQIVNILSEVNTYIYDLSHQENFMNGMSSTLIMSVVTEYGSFFVNVGDSRLYIVDDNNELVQLSKDHSLMNDLLERGEITIAEVAKHPLRNAVTNAIGIYSHLRYDLEEIKQNYKYMFLCSDGVSSYVDLAKLLDIINNQKLSLEKRNQLLTDLVYDVGAIDNFTYILMEADNYE